MKRRYSIVLLWKHDENHHHILVYINKCFKSQNKIGTEIEKSQAIIGIFATHQTGRENPALINNQTRRQP